MLLAQRDGIIAPSQFTFGKGFLMFVAIGLGGYGRLLTPIIGSFLVVGLPELLDLGPGVTQIAVGILFIVITLAVPGGIIGGIDAIGRALRNGPSRRRSSRRAVAAEAMPSALP